MRLWITGLALVLLLATGPAAVAQSGDQTPSATTPRIRAPIGHRQPRADEVPSEKHLADPNDPISREDAALDRKIKSICRGC